MPANPPSPPFDLLAFARSRRFRIRNLADGRQAPPFRRSRAQPLGPGYRRGTPEEDLAVVGAKGFLTQSGAPAGKLGVWIGPTEQVSRRIAAVKAAAAGQLEIVQRGDQEAFGWIPATPEVVFRVAATLGVFTRAPGPSAGRPENFGPPASDTRPAKSPEPGLVQKPGGQPDPKVDPGIDPPPPER